MHPDTPSSQKTTLFALSSALFCLLSCWTLFHTGCAECHYDADCAESSLCKQGRCQGNTPTEPIVKADASNTPDLPDLFKPPTSTTCTQQGETRACYLGPFQSVNIGLCKPGLQTCDGKQWGPCIGDVQPNIELCDNQDNDCNGKTDEDLFRPCGKSIGECKQGQQQCKNGQWQNNCEGGSVPQNEICDGKDNDCNGKLDDVQGTECRCNEGQERACGLNSGECKQGKQRCTNGKWSNECTGEVTKTQEICDGKDNDCDGKIDNPASGTCECLIGQTRSCGSNQGICQPGTQTCNQGRWPPNCDGATHPSAEICDGKDNDCNGHIDDVSGIVCECKDGDFRACGSDTGNCKKGTQRCTNGKWSIACLGATDPSIEICDGIDNDCDGKIDNVNGTTCECKDGESRPCGSDIGNCKKGSQRCSNGKWNAFCLGGVSPSIETCDGKDNDCNAKIDDVSCPKSGLIKLSPGNTYLSCKNNSKQTLSSELAKYCHFGNILPTSMNNSCLSHFPQGTPLDHKPCVQQTNIYSANYKGNYHFYFTQNPNWLGNSTTFKYTKGNPRFSIYTKPFPGSVPLRAYTNWTTRDTYINCSPSVDTHLTGLGYTSIEILGYTAPGPSNTNGTTLFGVNFLPLWRTYNSKIQVHFFTGSKVEHDYAINVLNYTDETTSCYILPP